MSFFPVNSDSSRSFSGTASSSATSRDDFFEEVSEEAPSEEEAPENRPEAFGAFPGYFSAEPFFPHETNDSPVPLPILENRETEKRVKRNLLAALDQEAEDLGMMPSEANPNAAEDFLKHYQESPLVWEKDPEYIVQEGQQALGEVTDHNFSPDKKIKRKLDEMLEALPKVSDTPRKKQRGNYAKDVQTQLWNGIAGNESSLLEQHEIIEQTFATVDTYRKLGEGLEKVFSNCVNVPKEKSPIKIPIRFSHIVDPEVVDPKAKKAVGFHFCPPSDPRYEGLLHKTFAPNGVFCASFCLEEGAPFKCSSFFSDKVETVEQLEQLILYAKPVCRSTNRILNYSVEHGLYFETLRRDGGILSAYPLFCCQKLEAPDQLHFIFEGERPLLGGEILDLVASSILKYNASISAFVPANNPVRYVNVPGRPEEELIAVDIASCFEGSHVPNGILFIVDRRFIEHKGVDLSVCLEDFNQR